MTTKTINILLADDHKIMREGLASLIRKETGMAVVGEAEDGLQAVQLAHELFPDVIIMDINMPGLDGTEATRRIHNQNPEIKILVLSMYSNKRFLVEMLRAGASGYLLKEQAFTELINAIHSVLDDHVFLCSKMSDIVVQDFSDRITKGDKPNLPALNSNESEVLRHIAEGKTSKEIALLLNKSSKTIDAYRRQIMNKLKIDNLADLIKFAIREGLVSLED